MEWKLGAILDKKTNQIIEEVPAPPIQCLVLEGGGVRGIAYARLVETLSQLGVLSSVERLAGSSIGAIAAALIALSYTESEVKDILSNLSFVELLETKKSWWLTPDFIARGKQYYNIMTSEGYSRSPGNRLLAWLETLVEKKLGSKNATFADLATHVEVYAELDHLFKYLYVTGSNLSLNQLDVFSHETTPHMPIALALRISASFPGFLKAVEWDNGQGVCLYSDGGVIDNLPYSIFNERSFLPKGYDFTNHGANPAVLNLKIDTKREFEGLLWRRAIPKKINSFKEFAMAILDGMASRDNEIYKQQPTNVIQVYDQDIDTLDLELDDASKQKLLEAGREAALEWFHNHVSEAIEIKIYQNESEWLSAKSIEELAAIRKRYEDLVNDIQDDKSSASVKDKIKFLNEYIFFRAQQLINPKLIFSLPFADHIDLPPLKPRKKIDEMIKNDIQKRLEEIEQHIELLEKKIASIKEKFTHAKIEHLHDAMLFDQIVYLIGLQEKIKPYQQARNDLLLKLNKPLDLDYKAIKSTLQTISTYQVEVNRYHTKFLAALSQHKDLAILINQHLTNRGIQFFGEDPNIQCQLALSDSSDFKIYIIALMIYFKFIQSTDALVTVTLSIYQQVFGTDDMPVDFAKLSEMLNKQGVDMFASAYRIEYLIKQFMLVDNIKYKEIANNITIDYVLSSLKSNAPKILPWKSRCQKKEDDETKGVELDYIYHTPSAGQFSIFYKSAEQVDSHDYTFKAPKGMRRL